MAALRGGHDFVENSFTSRHGLLAALRQRCKIAAVVTERGLQRGGGVRPGFIGGVHVSVQSGEEQRFAAAANLDLLRGARGLHLFQQIRIAIERLAPHHHQHDLGSGGVSQRPVGVVLCRLCLRTNDQHIGIVAGFERAQTIACPDQVSREWK